MKNILSILLLISNFVIAQKTSISVDAVRVKSTNGISITGGFSLGNGSTSAGVLKILEDTDNGSNFTTLSIGNQSADINYTLPTSAPVANGYLLSSTTAGLMSWSAGLPDGSYGDVSVSGTGTIMTVNGLYGSPLPGTLAPGLLNWSGSTWGSTVGQNLTKVDDTNVTLTLTGSPNGALIQSVGLTLGWTGTLADARIASAATWNAKQAALSNGSGTTLNGAAVDLGGTLTSNPTLTLTQNAQTLLRVTNASTGSSAISEIQASNGTQTLGMFTLGTSFGTSGIYTATNSYLRSSNALNLVTNTSSEIVFSINQTRVGGWLTTGNFNVGTSASSVAKLFVGQAALSAANAIPAFRIDGGAHTSLTTGTEFVGVNINTTQTKTWVTSLPTTQREIVFGAPTYSIASGSTMTTGATVAIAGAPIPAGSATITNPYALWVQSGNSAFAGNISLTTAGNKILIKEGSGGFMGQTTLVAGTKAITVSGVTTSTRCFPSLVTPSSASLTVQYQCSCTANTVTLQANLAATTINTADVSTLNYILFEPAP